MPCGFQIQVRLLLDRSSVSAAVHGNVGLSVIQQIFFFGSFKEPLTHVGDFHFENLENIPRISTDTKKFSVFANDTWRDFFFYLENSVVWNSPFQVRDGFVSYAEESGLSLLNVFTGSQEAKALLFQPGTSKEHITTFPSCHLTI